MEEYREAGKVITIAVERGFYGGVSSFNIEAEAFKRWDGLARINSSEDQARLLRNFKAAMAFQEVVVEP